MPHSYQDLDTRVRVLEDKIDLIMKTCTFNTSAGPQTLQDIYYAVKAMGLTLVNATEQEKKDGTE